MNDTAEAKKQFAIQKIYIKDLSFESPNSPKSFSFSKWDPKVDLNLTNQNTQIQDDVFEAVLCITVTISHDLSLIHI